VRDILMRKKAKEIPKREQTNPLKVKMGTTIFRKEISNVY